MIYKDFKGLKISALGMGAMRLPTVAGDDSKIDVAQAEKMIDYAFTHGINYYDTAWGYHSGNSELVVGELLAKYPRDKFFLATKFPGYDLSNMPKVKEIFAKQLEKCRVDYFDFYLFHNVCEMNIEQYLDPKYGVRDYLVEMKKQGKIKHLGFSCHGEIDVLKRFLDAYGGDVEFVQLQANWLDWTFQHVKEKVAILAEHGLPLWVMEPLRGGKLAKLTPEREQTLLSLRPGESIPAWSFRFLQTIPNVGVILSGMSTYEQIVENVKTFETERPLDKTEEDALLSIASDMLKVKTLPCTACRYCVSHCPQKLDIPRLLALYNEHAFTEGGFLAIMALSAIPKEKWPSACIACKSCERVCPQQIKIAGAMADFTKKLETQRSA